ncbi:MULTISPECIES: hypothetical protein [Sulfitobacter]|uniref:hypothetical protein n=1 Tax=Sulfitobacter TaxID=60136 RepID=UPI0004E3F82B|nr:MULTISPECIES: hypothetical protein [unclassified Sulfitobacter]PTA98370.1 hypothetical protein C8254_07700 [Sulfitobacter sp. CB-A]ULO19503.1 hypothetical protein IV89_002543 [Sulfitobacter sp. CB2047]
MSQERPNATAAPSRLTIGIVMATAVLTSLLTLSMVYGWTRFRVLFSTFPESDCWTYANQSICFFDNTMTSDGMIAALSSFYTNLIVILTLIGIIAALSLRYSAKQHVEAELPTLTENFFTKNSGKTLLVQQIAEESKEMKGTVDRLVEKSGNHGEFIAGFSERIERLEYLVEEMDTGETVTEPDEDTILLGADEHGV